MKKIQFCYKGFTARQQPRAENDVLELVVPLVASAEASSGSLEATRAGRRDPDSIKARKHRGQMGNMYNA